MGALYPDSGGRFLLVRLLCLASRLRNKSQAKHSSVINGTLLQPLYGPALVFVAPIFLARRQREAQKIVETAVYTLLYVVHLILSLCQDVCACAARSFGHFGGWIDLHENGIGYTEIHLVCSMQYSRIVASKLVLLLSPGLEVPVARQGSFGTFELPAPAVPAVRFG